MGVLRVVIDGVSVWQHSSRSFNTDWLLGRYLRNSWEALVVWRELDLDARPDVLLLRGFVYITTRTNVRYHELCRASTYFDSTELCLSIMVDLCSCVHSISMSCYSMFVPERVHTSITTSAMP